MGRSWIVVVAALELACGPGSEEGEEPEDTSALASTISHEPDPCVSPTPPWDPGDVELVAWQELVFVRSQDSRSLLMTARRDGSGLGAIHDGGSSPRASGDGTRLSIHDSYPFLLVENESPERMLLWPIAWAPTGARLGALQYDMQANVGGFVVHDFEAHASVLVDSNASPAELSWSRDAAFVAYATDDGVVWVADAITGEAHDVVRPETEVELALSPDGTLLAYTVDGAIELVELESGSASRVDDVADFDGTGALAWSPDGAWIAWTNSLFATDAGILRIDGAARFGSSATAEGRPRWSATSHFVAFLVPPDGEPCEDFDCSRMVVLDTDAGAESEHAYVRELAWAPTGDVVVAGLRERLGSTASCDSPSRVVVIDVATEEVTAIGELEENDARSDAQVVWRNE